MKAETSLVRRPVVAGKTFTNEIIADHPKKLEIIALDHVNTSFVNGQAGARGLVDFLSKNIDANTLLAVVVMERNGPRIIHDFTGDPAILVEAVKKLHASLNANDTVTMSRGENSEADVEALQLDAILKGADAGSISSPGQMAAVAEAQKALVDLSRQAQAGLITLENFQILAQYFRGVPGRKSLIWASTGFPFALGTNPHFSLSRNTTGDDWQRTFDMLTDANIAVYPVNIGGLFPGVNANNLLALNSTIMSIAVGGVAARSPQLSVIESGQFVDPIVGRHETMNSLSDATGGQSLYNLNDAADLFRRASQDAAQYYTLAYYSRDTGRYGWRKLAVKVDRKDLKVRARRGFLFADPGKRDVRNELLKDLKIAMTSDPAFTAIPLTGEWQQTEPAGKQKKVHFTLSIPPGVATIYIEHQNHISLDFAIEVTDGEGKNVALVSQRFDTHLARAGAAQVQSKGVRYANALALPPGKYTVHFVVRDNIRLTLGSMVTPLTVE